jgi:FkbM family methyltransferase
VTLPEEAVRRLPLTVRRVGAQLLGSVSIRIRGGPNAGLRWSLISSGRGYVSGRFEADRVAAITALLRPGDRFWDVGAHRGYISLAAARTIGPTGQVTALEPGAVNQLLLQRHVRLNRMANIRVLPVALCDEFGYARFDHSGSTITSRPGRGIELVPTRTIESLIEMDGAPPPDVIRIDAAGCEARILRGGMKYLSPDMLIWISVHTRALYEECCALLRGRDFRIFESARMVAGTSGAEPTWAGDQELLAVGRERAVAESRLAGLRLFHGLETATR